MTDRSWRVSWIGMGVERLIDLRELDLTGVTIEHIASSLAQINRWGGRTPVPYNVARHCLDVVQLARADGLGRAEQYECLMHDVTEAFIGDVCSPIKHAIPALGELERQVRAQLAPRFGIAVREPSYVPAYDLRARELERAYLCSGDARSEDWYDSRDRFIACAERLRAPVQARRPALRGRARCRHCTQPFEPGDRCPARASALGPLPCETDGG